MKEYIYYWYHHMMNDTDRKIVEKTIKEKDFEGFIEQYKKLNSKGLLEGKIYKEFDSFCPLIYLPDNITVYNENNDIIENISVLDRANFNKISYAECECG